MERDIELERKILFKIVDVYKPGEGVIWGLQIDGYDQSTIAEHCDLLHQQGLIKDFQAHYGDDVIQVFRVGNLTAHGYDFLELIKNDDVWEKTKTELEVKQRPKTLDEIARLAGIFGGAFTKELNS